jgi:hypothetical protein
MAKQKGRGMAALLSSKKSEDDSAEIPPQVVDTEEVEASEEAPAQETVKKSKTVVEKSKLVALSNFSHGDGHKSHVFKKGDIVTGLDEASLNHLCAHGLVGESK